MRRLNLTECVCRAKEIGSPGVKVRTEKIIWSSYYRFMVDALEHTGEEGHDKL